MIEDTDPSSFTEDCNKDAIVVCTFMANSINTDTLSTSTDLMLDTFSITSRVETEKTSEDIQVSS